MRSDEEAESVAEDEEWIDERDEASEESKDACSS